ncbi:MAG: peptidylprolyl isomerase [Desulfobacterales bacterium]|nr:peptidylprolyl isomerase [Desulfobacterales bacterium]
MKYCKSWILTLVCLALATSAFAQNEPARVRLETTKGAIVVELDAQAAPKTTANFLAYVNEADNGLKNKIGTIAMARTGDPHSATAQFFINVADNAPLDHKAKTTQEWGYCVFGKVIEGLEVVRAIEALPTSTQGFHQNVPVEPVIVKSAKRLPPPTPPAPPAPALK